MKINETNNVRFTKKTDIIPTCCSLLKYRKKLHLEQKIKITNKETKQIFL